MTTSSPAFPSPLFIFELANNHMGSVEHGLRIIRELGGVAREFPFQCAVKLQYRHLDTFIHPAFRDRRDIKFVKRFSETRLTEEEFRQLREAIRTEGMLACCTPFDEASVDLIESHAYDFLKIASCSLTDWPLLERIVLSPLRVIASTAAVDFEDIDRVVGFFEHRAHPLALMHCVAEYPTPDHRLALGQITALKRRYPNHVVGYSTHERPDQTEAVKVALGCGAQIFEKHVGVATEQWPLNAYSANPAQVRDWLQAAREGIALCGDAEQRYDFSQQERGDLHSLRRGVFSRRAISAGEQVEPGDVVLAIPTAPGQLVANDLSKYADWKAVRDLAEGAPVMASDVHRVDHRDKVKAIVERVAKFLKKSRLPLPRQVDLEISHHYGIENFDRTGAVLLNFINREYCKKIIVMLPGQSHPEHWHEKKEETFHVQYGDMTTWLNGQDREYRAGDLLLVPRGTKHSFSTKGGVIFEEISSTHHANDSFYSDAQIMANTRRKTLLTYWM